MCDQENDLVPRPGEIMLDKEEIVEILDDAPRILHVGGLLKDDFAVFMQFEQFDEELTSVGYLVTAVDDEGDGVIVLGDVIQDDPRGYLSEHVSDMLLRVGEDQLAEFSLQSLYRHVAMRKAV